MSIPIAPTRPVLGDQAVEFVRSVESKKYYHSQKLDFKISEEAIERVKEVSRRRKEVLLAGAVKRE